MGQMVGPERRRVHCTQLHVHHRGVCRRRAPPRPYSGSAHHHAARNSAPLPFLRPARGGRWCHFH
jgi:hypothetical protein